MDKLVSILLFLIFSLTLNAQNDTGFRFKDPDQRSEKIKFELVNNLIIVPIKLNGVELTFLIDSGVDKTLLIALGAGDSLDLKKAQKVKIRGLGSKDSFEAFQSIGNTLEINDAININQEVYFIIDKNNELAKRLGLPVNGIIGYDFFKDFIVRVNYKTKYIKLYNPDKFNRKLRRYDQLPLQFYKNKPYARLKVEDESISKSNLTFLIDTGSGSSFWFLENEHINEPELYFQDILGYGLSSIIEGKRAKVKKVLFGKYEFEEPNSAYPDVQQILEIEKNVVRDGTVGAEVLRRFKLFFDYPNKRIYFRPNMYFDDSFNYDMSGIVFDFDGVKIVKELKNVRMKTKSDSDEISYKNTNDFIISIGVKPKVVVKAIRDQSPAKDVDILPGDELLTINGKNAYDLSLEQIQSILAEKEGNKVKLEFLRNNKNIEKEIYLRDRLKDLLNNSEN